MAHFDKAAVGEEKWLMQLGTLSGNPVAAVAGLKTMEILARPGAYDQLRATGNTLMTMLSDTLSEAGVAHQIVGDATLFDVVFTDKPVRSYRDALGGDNQKNAAFNARLREKGIFKSPGKLYPSLALTEGDLSLTADAVAYAVKYLGP